MKTFFVRVLSCGVLSYHTLKATCVEMAEAAALQGYPLGSVAAGSDIEEA